MTQYKQYGDTVKCPHCDEKYSMQSLFLCKDELKKGWNVVQCRQNEIINGCGKYFNVYCVLAAIEVLKVGD